MVKTYSLRRDGNEKLSADFMVREFRCHDGSDLVMVDEALVEMLQRIRDHYSLPVIISSAYRTVAYNSKIGGAAKSQHLYGRAADIRIGGVNPRDIVRWVETEISPGGLGLYDYKPGDKSGFVHVDTRTGKGTRWVQTKPGGSAVTVNSIVHDYLDKDQSKPLLKVGSAGEEVLAMKHQLVTLGFSPYGDLFDEATKVAVRAFQEDRGLQADGIVGTKTWDALESTQ